MYGPTCTSWGHPTSSVHVLVLQNGCRCYTCISLKIGRCCCSTGPGIPPAWPATVPGGAGTTHGAVADRSMPFLWHMTPTWGGTNNDIARTQHTRVAAYTGWDTNQKHCIAQQRASTAGNSNGNTPTAGTLQEDFIVVCCSSARGFTALHARLLCCCLCVYIHTYIHTYLVLYLVRSTILLSCRSYNMNIISSSLFVLFVDV